MRFFNVTRQGRDSLFTKSQGTIGSFGVYWEKMKKEKCGGTKQKAGRKIVLFPFFLCLFFGEELQLKIKHQRYDKLNFKWKTWRERCMYIRAYRFD